MKTICSTNRGGIKTQAITATQAREPSEIIAMVERAIGGNFSAFGELYSIYLDRIYRYVFYQVRDRMTAEDITEEVFLKAWKSIASCKGKEPTFVSWLYRIAHNHMINTLKRMNKTTSIEGEDFAEITDQSREIEAEIEREDLLEMITCLPEKQKEIIILKFIEGMDNGEISQVTGKSEGAVRISQMRALETLKQKLGDREVEK